MLWGAFVRQLPPSFTHFRAQKSITLLSGPLSSLVFGSAILAIAATTNSGSVLELFSKVGLITFLGVLELIPSCRNGIGSDGYRLREVLGGGEPLDEMYREMLAETSNFTAVRYRDWPREALMRLAASGDPYNVYLAYLHMLDAGDLETAAAYMRRLIALLPEQEPYPHYAAEAAYWLAVYGCDSDAARKWLECTGPSLDEAARLQAEAAVAWAEGRSEYAAGLVKQGLALAAALEECGFVACYVDQMKAILNAAPVAHGIKLVEA
jgi:hypothetical protein